MTKPKSELVVTLAIILMAAIIGGLAIWYARGWKGDVVGVIAVVAGFLKAHWYTLGQLRLKLAAVLSGQPAVVPPVDAPVTSPPPAATEKEKEPMTVINNIYIGSADMVASASRQKVSEKPVIESKKVWVADDSNLADADKPRKMMMTRPAKEEKQAEVPPPPPIDIDDLMGPSWKLAKWMGGKH